LEFVSDFVFRISCFPQRTFRDEQLSVVYGALQMETPLFSVFPCFPPLYSRQALCAAFPSAKRSRHLAKKLLAPAKRFSSSAETQLPLVKKRFSLAMTPRALPKPLLPLAKNHFPLATGFPQTFVCLIQTAVGMRRSTEGIR
jgi:hypothetical protein